MAKRWPDPTTIVVTGASSGLGAALARAYAAPGITLGLVARRADRLAWMAEACRRAGAEAHVLVCDVADGDALEACLVAFDRAHPVDLMIANAGVSAGPSHTSDPFGTEGGALAASVIATNLTGAIRTIEALLPAMLARGSGHVAAISSVAAFRGLPDSPAYCASKAGLRLYAEALRARLLGSGVAVSVAFPGFFTSPMSDRFQGARPLMVSADAMAATIRAGLDRRTARIVSPLALGLLLRLLDILPAALGDRLIRLSRFRIETAD